MPVRARGRRGREEPPPLRAAPDRVLAGRALLRGRLQPVEIGIDADGRIQRIARSVMGGRRVDVGDQVILPAATDLHVHLREPGGPAPAETFRSGTEAAALGGVATVADMPNTIPPVTTADRLRDKAERARGQLAIDVVLYAGLRDPTTVAGLGREAGALKLFLSATPGLEEPPETEVRQALLEAAAATGLGLTVHAEDPRRFRDDGPPASPRDWDRQRPVEAELAAIDSLRSAPLSLRLHVAHVTSADAVERLASAGLSFEATPHHLLLSAGAGPDPRVKVNPPLRSEAVRTGLWEAFRDGRVPCLASDHAPHLKEEKERPFADAPSGMPGVETMLPLMLEKVRAGDLSLEVLLRAACDHPARWLGLPHGRLAPGHRANLLVVDFRDRALIREDRLRTACGWSAFARWPAIFPRKHFRDGDLIVDEGSYVGGAPGRVIRPDYAEVPLSTLERR